MNFLCENPYLKYIKQNEITGMQILMSQCVSVTKGLNLHFCRMLRIIKNLSKSKNSVTMNQFKIN